MRQKMSVNQEKYMTQKSNHARSHKVVMMDNFYCFDYIGDDKVYFNMDDWGTLKEEG